MPSIQVRDLPEQIYRKLKINAKKDHRSLSQQAIVTLKKGLGIDSNSTPHFGQINFPELTISLKSKVCFSNLEPIIFFNSKERPIEYSTIVIPRTKVFIRRVRK